MANDQFEYWNDPSVAAHIRAGVSGVSKFAKEVEAELPRDANVLEIGCGTGDDAAYLAQQGHSVIALDVSEPLLDLAMQRFADMPQLTFLQADVTRPLQVGRESCDAVFARYSLHYFDDETTARIFSEIAWVLRPGGKLHFMCKSIEDPLYDKGVELGPDLFEFGGEIRHFFSVTYTNELLSEAGLRHVRCSTGREKHHGDTSVYIRCTAAKP